MRLDDGKAEADLITVEVIPNDMKGELGEITDLSDETFWIVDVKSIHSSIYKEYTGNISGVLQHLYCLKGLVDDKSKVKIKVPYIPGFNDNDDIDKDIERIKERYGFMNVVKTTYIIK